MYAEPTRCVRGRNRVRHRQRHNHQRPNPVAAGIDSTRVDPDSADQDAACVIAVIDPKPLTRQSLVEMLAGLLAPDRRLVGASCIDELLAPEAAAPGLASSRKLRSLLLYIRSAGVADQWVQEQLRAIRTRAPNVPVILISDRDDSDNVLNALNQGLRGYITTSSAVEVAIAALTLIEAGGTYVPAHALRSVAEPTVAPDDGIERAHPPEETELPKSLNLTSRELAVIHLLREGNANKVIAYKLDMRESTVKVHVRNILKKLRVTNRTHAATVANRLLGNSHSNLSIERLPSPSERSLTDL